jgi:hypothetical protein
VEQLISLGKISKRSFKKGYLAKKPSITILASGYYQPLDPH